MHYNHEIRSFILSKADVAAIVEFASADKFRSALRCVEFDSAAGSITATDGHTLCTVRTATPPVADAWEHGAIACVPADALQIAARSLRKGETLAVHAISADAVRITAGSAVSAVPTLAATDPGRSFPDWRSVLPDRASADARDGARVVGVNPELLARIALIARAIGGAKSRAVALTLPPEPLTPIMAHATDPDTAAEWCALVMPMRIA